MNWTYYNHAAIPTTAPHEKPDLAAVEDGSVWKMKGRPILARWSSDWDCGHETEWWYCIKDDSFDIMALKSKRRYEINKGKKNFKVKKIRPDDYTDSLWGITIRAYSSWPEKYRPHIDRRVFDRDVSIWMSYDVFGAFNNENDKSVLSGYAVLIDHGCYVDFSILRVNPDLEKLAINAAIVDAILEYYKERFDDRFYISDGSRAIRHETEFQEYLEKYFCFRKAYCRLNVKYKNMGCSLIIDILYKFRKCINSDSKIGNRVLGLLKMEEIRRSF